MYCIYCKKNVEGINKRCNSIDKLIELLKILADGYDVITIGSSAGGYMSALIGGVLNSKISFVFSGQFDLFSDFSFETKELLVKHQKDSEYSKWYDISSFYKSNMVYFCPVNSYCDKAQLNKLYNQVESNNRIKEKESQIDVLLNQRFDLIPNIVECVKGYAKHESSTLER